MCLFTVYKNIKVVGEGLIFFVINLIKLNYVVYGEQ